MPDPSVLLAALIMVSIWAFISTLTHFVPLWPFTRGSEESEPKAPKPKTFTLEEQAWMDAEWKQFCLSPEFEVLDYSDCQIKTVSGSYEACRRYPGGVEHEWETEEAPVDGALRKGFIVDGLHYVHYTLSEFRLEFPDIDPLTILRGRLATKLERARLRTAAEKTLGVAAEQKKVSDPRVPA